MHALFKTEKKVAEIENLCLVSGN